MTDLRTRKAPGAVTTSLVEKKDIGYIEPGERSGQVRHMFTTWWSANAEFATVATGVLGTFAFGLSFWQAALAILFGNILGALALAGLSVFGAKYHAPQLVQSRVGFGLYGNNVPALLNTVAGISWFAVNSVLGAFAMDRLFGIPLWISIVVLTAVQVVIALFGHDAIHKTEYALMWALTLIFGVACVYGFFFSHAHLGGGFNPKVAGPLGFTGAFILMMSIALSYCLGWLAFASDYSRRLPDSASKRRVFVNVAAAMLITGVVLEMLGAALGTLKFIGSPTDLMSGVLPHAVAIITLVGVVVGTVTANALNLYSGTMSFKVLAIPGLHRVDRRVVVLASGVLGGLATYFLGRNDFYLHYQEFLFVLGYWVAPWFAIVLVDGLMGRINRYRMYDGTAKFAAGLVCWLVAIAVEIPFMNQQMFTGWIAKAHPTWGDITYYVGFVVAAVLYAAWRAVRRGPVVRRSA